MQCIQASVGLLFSDLSKVLQAFSLRHCDRRVTSDTIFQCPRILARR